jgi:8-oxo-dGTP pyrophosphatase MutT (NUDIX family)
MVLRPFYGTRGRKGAKASMEKPRDSATVILTRESSPGELQVFLMRRHRDQDFMGGAFVFPGGRLDEGDCDPDLLAHTGGFTGADAKRCLQSPDLPEETALGLFFAALRETFEESGVLLALDETGRVLDLAEGEKAGRFARYRLQIHDHSLSLTELAERERISFALDLLVPYAHWITPEIESKRFSTRFFLARKPPEQLPFHDTIEMTKSQWLSPSAALEMQKAGQILLMPPTLKTMEELNEFDSLEELFRSARSRRVQTILPEAFMVDDGFGVRLPHDPEYKIEAYKQPPRPGETSRIVMRDGLWRTECDGDLDPSD